LGLQIRITATSRSDNRNVDFVSEKSNAKGLLFALVVGRIFDQPSHLPLFTRQDRHIQQLKPLLNAIIVVFFRTTRG